MPIFCSSFGRGAGDGGGVKVGGAVGWVRMASGPRRSASTIRVVRCRRSARSRARTQSFWPCRSRPAFLGEQSRRQPRRRRRSLPGRRWRDPGSAEQSGADQDANDVLTAHYLLAKWAQYRPAGPACLPDLCSRDLRLGHRSPVIERIFYETLTGPAALGIILDSDGKRGLRTGPCPVYSFFTLRNQQGEGAMAVCGVRMADCL